MAKGESKICCECGAVFFMPRNYSRKQWELAKCCSRSCSHRHVRKIDTNEAIFLYLHGLSSVEVGTLLGCTGTHIARLISPHYPLREGSEAQTIAGSRESRRQKSSLAAKGRRHKDETKAKLRLLVGSKSSSWRQGLTISGNGYLQFTSSPANGEHCGKMLHQVIAEWWFGRKVMPGEHVHHLDGNKLNNDPNNLIIMTASAHSKLHTPDRENGKRSQRL